MLAPPERAPLGRKTAILAVSLAVAIVALFAAALPSSGCGLSRYGSDPDDASAPCANSLECDDQNPCTTDGCAPMGTCVWTAVPDGPSPAPIAGNCKVERCKAGVPIELDDDTDIADDGESCTKDVCVAGKPSHLPIADGSPCSKAGTAGRCVAGACTIDCGEGLPACPSTDACVASSCDLGLGVCVFTKLHGVPVPGHAEAGGDCKVDLCVMGVATEVVDDGDLPITATTCDEELCKNGVPSNPVLAAGTPCTDGPNAGVCNASGGCVECNSPTDCAGVDDECKTRTCILSKCGFAYAPNGTKLAAQVPDDCKTAICDGQGNKTTAPDLADDDDMLECTVDSCGPGGPSHVAKPPGTKCGMPAAATICDGAGKCVGCITAMDCTGGDDCKTPVCDPVMKTCGISFVPAGTAIPAAKQIPNDCHVLACDGSGNVVPLVDDTDEPLNPCKACVSGNQVVQVGASCALDGGLGVCSPSATCVECNAATDCPATGVFCVDPACSMLSTCTTSFKPAGTVVPTGQVLDDCKDIVCDGMGMTTTQPNPNDYDDNNPCTVDSCMGTTPVHAPAPAGPPPTGMCTLPNKVCDGAGACVQCNTDPNCGANQVCVSHVCCTKSTCMAQGRVCGPAPDMCGGSLDCGMCPGQVCVADVTTAAKGCDAAGTCSLGGATTPCPPYHCNAAGDACLTSCAADADCTMGNVCDTTKNPHTCGLPKGPGAMCNRNAECASMSCVSNLCV